MLALLNRQNQLARRPARARTPAPVGPLPYHESPKKRGMTPVRIPGLRWITGRTRKTKTVVQASRGKHAHLREMKSLLNRLAVFNAEHRNTRTNPTVLASRKLLTNAMEVLQKTAAKPPSTLNSIRGSVRKVIASYTSVRRPLKRRVTGRL